MPAGGAYTPLPQDARVTGSTPGQTGAFVSDAAYQTGYKVACTPTTPGMHLWDLAGTFSLGDGDWCYLVVELQSSTDYLIAVATLQWANVGGLIIETEYSIANGLRIRARWADQNSADHTGAWYGLTRGPRYVVGAGVKRYQSGGNWVVDVVLQVDGSTVDTLSASTISGSDKTAPFTTGTVGTSNSWGKGAAGTFWFGTAKVNFSEATVDTGSDWTQADVDALSMRLTQTGADAASIYACGLTCVYDTSASFDGWPTTSTVIDYRLPTSDGSPVQWTCSSGTDHYALVDDVFGSYSTTDKLTATGSSGSVDVLGVGDLSLSGKTVGLVGVHAAGILNFNYALQDGGGTYCTAKPTTRGWVWWHKNPGINQATAMLPERPVLRGVGRGVMRAA